VSPIDLSKPTICPFNDVYQFFEIAGLQYTGGHIEPLLFILRLINPSHEDPRNARETDLLFNTLYEPVGTLAWKIGVDQNDIR
jgi:hypothetical protein